MTSKDKVAVALEGALHIKQQESIIAEVARECIRSHSLMNETKFEFKHASAVQVINAPPSQPPARTILTHSLCV